MTENIRREAPPSVKEFTLELIKTCELKDLGKVSTLTAIMGTLFHFFHDYQASPELVNSFLDQIKETYARLIEDND